MMHRRKRSKLIFLVVIGLLLFGICVSMFYFSKQTPPSSQIITTSETYSDTSIPFSFSYPTGWRQIPPLFDGENFLATISIASPDYKTDDGAGIYTILEGAEFTIQVSESEYPNIMRYKADTFVDGAYKTNPQDIKVHDIDAVKYLCGHPQLRTCISFIKDGNLYAIYGSPQGTYEKELDEVVNSFRFN